MLTFKKYGLFLAMVVITAMIFSASTVSAFSEPASPSITAPVDARQEEELASLADQPVDVVFKELQTVQYRVDSDLMHRAIFAAFDHRSEEAVGYAIGRLKGQPANYENFQPQREIDAFVSRNILAVFPDETAEQLPAVYESSDPYRRGALILAVGSVAGGPVIQDLLIDALNDTRAYESRNPEMAGEPLRICDVAYNQLVLRYEVPDVLRTIGVSHGIDDRDLHIEKMKQLLAN